LLTTGRPDDLLDSGADELRDIRDRHLMRAPGVEIDPFTRAVTINASAMIADDADAEFASALENFEPQVLRHGYFVKDFTGLGMADNRAAGRDDPALEAELVLKFDDVRRVSAGGDDDFNPLPAQPAQRRGVLGAKGAVRPEQRVVHVENGEAVHRWEKVEGRI
jgi:hypothetical protein